MEHKLRVCSLLSGCGGLDLGFVKAGFERRILVGAFISCLRLCIKVFKGNANTDW